MSFPTEWPQFFTATIHRWLLLLKEDGYKDIIISTLKFLVDDNRIELSAFTIMSNHVHIIWQPLQHHTLSQIQASFMRQTAKQLLKHLQIDHPEILEKLKINKPDRVYQVWKREPLSIELFTQKVFLQKLEYIHNNPVAAGLVTFPEEYKYSSAEFYETGVDAFNMVTHYTGN